MLSSKNTCRNILVTITQIKTKRMKLSIITINYNNKEGLRKTIDSVMSQTFKDYEWIIIDGGSTDGSREVIEAFSENFVYWCCEPDSGVYNAMNKGISRAQGEYLSFMNSGDCYYEKNTLENIFKQEVSGDILYGDVIYQFGNKDVLQCAPRSLSLYHLYKSTIYHQSSFIKKELFLDSGYDEKLKIVSDWKKWIEWVLQNKKYQYLPMTVAKVDTTGISMTNHTQREDERKFVLDEIFSECIIRDYDAIKDYERLFAYNPELEETLFFLKKRRLYKRMIKWNIRLMSLISNFLK